jgi:MFS family permease
VRRSPIGQALRQARFRRFFAARTISQWGDTFQSVAIVILVYQLTGSGLRVAATVAFEILPVLLFGFIAGSVVDRWPRRRVMVTADVVRAVVALLLALSHEQLWVAYAAAFGLSIGRVFFDPASASVVPALVADEDQLLGANSAVWSAAVLSQIALAPLAGALVAWAGPGPAFAINAASFAISALLVAGLPAFPVTAAVRTSARTHIREGLQHIRASRLLTTLAVVQALAALSAGATSALLVVLAEQHLHVGAARFGLLIGAIGIGAGLGPLALQSVVNDVRRPAFLFGPYLLRGFIDLVLATFSSFTVALAALAGYGVGTATGNVAYNTTLQTVVPDQTRGRVFAFYDVVWQTARLISIGVGGILADAIGIQAVYYLGAALLLIAGTWGLSRSRGARLSA